MHAVEYPNYVLHPVCAAEPSAELKSAIDEAFGSMDELKKQLKAAGATQFGSGWAWLVKVMKQRAHFHGFLQLMQRQTKAVALCTFFSREHVTSMLAFVFLLCSSLAAAWIERLPGWCRARMAS